MKPKLLGATVIAVLVTFSACGGTDHSQHSGASQPADDENDTAGFGTPAQAASADRTIKVHALDELAFHPGKLSVKEGETIRFVVTNDGRTRHEFVIGDEAYQDEHQQAMAHGGAHDGELGNAVDLPPGETGELTWTFTTPGEVMYACHVAGHYDGGMVGTVSVGD